MDDIQFSRMLWHHWSTKFTIWVKVNSDLNLCDKRIIGVLFLKQVKENEEHWSAKYKSQLDNGQEMRWAVLFNIDLLI